LPEDRPSDLPATQPDPADGQSILPPQSFWVEAIRILRFIVIGPEGLRALWGILLFLILRKTLPYCIYPIFQALFPEAPGDSASISARSTFVYEGAGLACVVLATWLMAKIERRPVAAYGFSPRHSLRNFAAGLAWGVAALSLLVFLLRATGMLVFDARLLSGASILRYGAVWLAGFLLVGLFEEILNRGYLQYTLTRGLSGTCRLLFSAEHSNQAGFWIAALILSFAFGFGHRTNPGESPLGLLSAGLAGLLFCLSLWRTGSLWWAIGFHASWDWAQSFLYGVADSGLMVQGHLYATHPVGRPYLSGGLTGPEGSLLLLPVLAAAVGMVQLTLPRIHSGYKPANTPSAPLH
jgi:hypothetical protein